MNVLLGPGLSEFVETAERNNGFRLKELEVGALFEVRTEGGSKYKFIVMDPDEGMVAMSGTRKELRKLSVYFLQGSTFGGSAVKIGWIGVGLRIRMNMTKGGLLTTRPVELFTFVNDPDQARELMAEAEKIRPQEMTESDVKEMAEKIDTFVRETFASGDVDRVIEFVHEFSIPDGRIMMASLLRAAHDADKLDDAFEVLDRHMREHWARRPSQLRGTFITEQDVYYVDLAYKELGLPVPS